MAKIEQQLANIASMRIAEFDEHWQTSFGEVPPALPLSLLRRALAYHVQELAFGGLTASVKQMLDRLTDRPQSPSLPIASASENPRRTAPVLP